MQLISLPSCVVPPSFSCLEYVVCGSQFSRTTICSSLCLGRWKLLMFLRSFLQGIQLPVFIASSVISIHLCNTCQHFHAEFTCNLWQHHGDKTKFRDVRILILQNCRTSVLWKAYGLLKSLEVEGEKGRKSNLTAVKRGSSLPEQVGAGCSAPSSSWWCRAKLAATLTAGEAHFCQTSWLWVVPAK